MRVLVTGGAGFLGSHLCEALLMEGHEVLSLDNYFTGSRGNIKPFLQHPRFEAIRHDIINPIDLEVEAIYNLACPASPVHYQFDPVRTVQANVLGVTHMLELARRTKARILQASTSEVYGDPQIHPQNGILLGACQPDWNSKLLRRGKAGCRNFDDGLPPAVSGRYPDRPDFYTYGPRMAMEDGRGVSNFILQALKNEPLTVYGEGRQTRSFCYVSDMIDGLIRMMQKEKFTGPVNLGKLEEVSVLELAEKIITLTESRSKIVRKPLPQDDPIKRRPDITLAKEKLRWEPRIKIDEGLPKTIAYFDKLLSEGNQ